MARVSSIVEYCERHPIWSKSLQLLFDLCFEAGLDASIKWGAPYFTYKGKNIVGITAFKNHFALWFPNGSFLSDPAKKLINANEEKTKGLLQWRFTAFEEIDRLLILSYFHEAIENEKQGKRITIERNKAFTLPDELQFTLAKNKNFASSFSNLTTSKQREYAEYIGAAKREETRLSRVEKCIPLILAGGGLYDKYKK